MLILFFKIFLTKEKPLECRPLEGMANIISFFLLFFYLIFYFYLLSQQQNQHIKFTLSYVSGISAVSPPTNSQPEILHPFTIPRIIDFNFDKLILFIEI